MADGARARLVRLLQDGRRRSGEMLAHELGIGRAAIREHIRALRAWGLEIEAVRGAGYRLMQPVELLDKARIRNGLDRAVAGEITVEVSLALESTSTYLMSQRLGTGVNVCLAEYQTAGRGRRGQLWVSPFGANLCLSIGWRFAAMPPDFATLSLAVGIVCADFLRGFGAQGVSVKWPNDLVIAGRKLGGILVERRGGAGGSGQLVIGIGLNVGMSAVQGEPVDQPWIDLTQALPDMVQGPPSRNRLAAGLINAVAGARDDFQGVGFEPFYRRWPEFDAVRDREVCVQTAKGVIEGIARGVDADGALLLDTGSGWRRMFSGEVSLRVARAVPASSLAAAPFKVPRGMEL